MLHKPCFSKGLLVLHSLTHLFYTTLAVLGHVDFKTVVTFLTLHHLQTKGPEQVLKRFETKSETLIAWLHSCASGQEVNLIK